MDSLEKKPPSLSRLVHSWLSTDDEDQRVHNYRLLRHRIERDLDGCLCDSGEMLPECFKCLARRLVLAFFYFVWG